MTKKSPSSRHNSFARFILKSLAFFAGLGVCLLVLFTLAVQLTWTSLPDLKAMTDYRPRLPLHIYSADKVLLAEYGEERRNVLNIQEIPLVMRQAILAAEDDDFYSHGGVNWMGVARAAIANLTSGAKTQGASTITMQLARNFYLSSQKKFTRKFYELLLTYKIERNLSKDQILELYMNQIYLGHRSYGFAAASRTYFNKPLSEISLAEAAVLASLPKSPSRVNPRNNLKATLQRQGYVLTRMLNLGYITQEQYQQAKAETIHARPIAKTDEELKGTKYGQYVAELARQLMYSQYGDDVYGRGLNIYTTINSTDQKAAYDAVRAGVLAYTRRKPYPGPAEQLDLPEGIENDPDKMQTLIQSVREKHPDSDGLLTAIVLSASPTKVVLMRDAGKPIDISGKGLNNAKRALVGKSKPERTIRRGSVVYIEKIEGYWSIINLPIVQGALLSMDPNDGAIKAMIGGFDFNLSDFNRATQAWRQPGSTFKPFIYAAALERGITPETVVSDQPFFLPASKTGGKPWQPKNYGNKYTPSQSMRMGLYKSKNMVSIYLLEAIGPDYARQFVERMGFDLQKQPPRGAYLTMALGAGNVTALQMANSYSVFANGGYKVNPYLIDYVEDKNFPDGKVMTIMKARPLKAGDEANRAIDPRTAYVMNNLLRGVATSGTAASSRSLGRSDLAGKTGTTNNSFDAWFAGYTPKLVTVTWLGFDQPTSLGTRETGGGAALPIWKNFMAVALKDIPQLPLGEPPEGLIQHNGNFYFSEFPPGVAITSVGLDSHRSFNLQESVPIQGGSDAIGHLLESFNPTGGEPIRF